MEWVEIGKRIRTQREFMGFTRETLAESLDKTPKFCSDIELGIRGMSVPTLCKISEILRLSTDYILFGSVGASNTDSISLMLQSCTEVEREYGESLLKTFLKAMNAKNGPL